MNNQQLSFPVSIKRSSILFFSTCIGFSMLWLLFAGQLNASSEVKLVSDNTIRPEQKSLNKNSVLEYIKRDTISELSEGNSLLTDSSELVTTTFVGTGQSIGDAVSNDVKLGDLNGDGTLDAIVANHGENKIWFNDGLGFFYDSQQFLGDGISKGAAVGDIDNDGDLDILFANYDEPNALWINVEGEFEQTQTFTDVTLSNDLALGDFNNDGYLDIVFANDGNNEVWINIGGEKFLRQKSITSGKTYGVGIADINNDLCLDIVFLYQGAFLNTVTSDAGEEICTGEFKSKEDPKSVPDHTDRSLEDYIEEGRPKEYEFPTSTEMTLSDINNDGAIDFIVAYRDIYVFLNDGSGNFSDIDEIYDSGPGDRVYGIEFADFDFDEDLDVFVTQKGSSRNGILENISLDEVKFKLTQSYASNYSQAVALGDLNGDGYVDAFVAGGRFIGGKTKRNAANQVVINQSFALMGSSIQLSGRDPSVGGGWHDDSDIELIDLNFDGRPEAIINIPKLITPTQILAISGELQNTHQFTFSEAINPFTSGYFLPTSECSSIASPDNITVGDVDNDGDSDIFAFYGKNVDHPTTIRIFRNTLNEGDKRFTCFGAISISNGGQHGNVALGDLNGDGFLDMAVSNNASSPDNLKQFIYFNDKGKKYLDGQVFGEGSSFDLAIGDLDGDVDLDIFRVDYWNQPNKVYFNQGDGSFTESAQDLGAFSSLSVVLADFDGDGDLDAAEARYNSGVAIWWNNGKGYFSEQLILWEPADRIDVKSIDINNDGLIDLYVTTQGGGRIQFLGLVNLGFGQFRQVKFGEDEGTYFSAAIMGDLDQDGDNDLIWGYEDQLLIEENKLFGLDSTRNNFPYLTITRPIIYQTNTGLNFAPEPILEERYIKIPFKITDPDGHNVLSPTTDIVGQVKGYFSFNGGGQWFEAQPKNLDETLHLLPRDQDYEFIWDTFGSGFYGLSRNVVFRLEAHPHTTLTSTKVLTITEAQKNRVAGPFQHAPSSATTAPFQVRGTQVHVADNLGKPVEGAYVFNLPEDSLEASLLGNPYFYDPFITDGKGFLSGRGILQPNDLLYAAVPVSYEYRIPPQLIFGGSGEFSVDLSIDDSNVKVEDKWTTEMWLLPTGDQGRILSLGNDFQIDYSTHISKTDETKFTLSNSVLLTTTELNELFNGLPHHLAVTWIDNVDSNIEGNLKVYIDGEESFAKTVALSIEKPNSFSIGNDLEGYVDDIRLWSTIRSASEISASRFVSESLLNDDLVGYWPIQVTDDSKLITNTVNNDLIGTLEDDVFVWFKPLYTLFHTSGEITSTGTVSTVNNVQFSPVSVDGGVQTLTVSADHPLVIYDLDVSLEWDARNDSLFLFELADSFKKASSLLFDVTHGQVALGKINLYHEKANWHAADIVFYADNSLRPSAAIGGVTDYPRAEVVTYTQTPGSMRLTKTVSSAYLPGQIRVGPVWDPYAERTADLGEEWIHMLTHELAHYLLYLPDNYIGINDEDRFLKLITCEDSFMTLTQDPTYYQFLTRNEWQGACLDTLAQDTTGRTDWETILNFYPFLTAPEDPQNTGPSGFPLNLTTLIPWGFPDRDIGLPERNFDVRNSNDERLRLPSAEAYLIKKYDPNDDSDDVLISLGNPIGGGDRLKVRGASEGDRLCLFDFSNSRSYSGCIEQLTAEDAKINVKPISDIENFEDSNYPVWQPVIKAKAISATSIALTVTLSNSNLGLESLRVQIFPMHYGSVAGNAKIATMEPLIPTSRNFTTTFTTKLPTYEIGVRVWLHCNNLESVQRLCSDNEGVSQYRESITFIRLNPKWDEDTVPDDLIAQLYEESIVYAPIGGPNYPGVGGPNYPGVGGPNYPGVGGPNYPGVGGPNYPGVGGPNYPGVGGPNYPGVGGPNYPGVGGPNYPGVGGPNYPGVGGPNYPGVGGPNYPGVGGPNYPGVGGPSLTGVGTAAKSLSAPVLSGDAQMAVYNVAGFFEDTFIDTIQVLPVVPNRNDAPWLIPIGNAYRVELLPETDLVLAESTHAITFHYLQRDVPDGYEYALNIYFLRDCELDSEMCHWEPLETTRFVENVVSAPLVPALKGTYIVMATLPGVQLQSGWNLFNYSLPLSQTVESAFKSIDSAYEIKNAITVTAQLTVVNGILQIPNLSIVDDSSDNPEDAKKLILKPNQYYLIKLGRDENSSGSTEADGTSDETIVPLFAPPRTCPNGKLTFNLDNCDA